MDIVTHAMLGIISAGPVADRPEVAAGLLFGSVAPDLDSLSRVFGKRAFVRTHQSWSHALPVLAVVAAAAACWPGLGMAFGIAFFAGAALHVLLDYTNTLGVKLLWPFNRRRLQCSIVFFIDAFVLAVSAAGCVATVRNIFAAGESGAAVPAAVACILGAYWILKAVLRRIAETQVGPDTVSILPSAFAPWKFLVFRRQGQEGTVEEWNVFTKSGVPRHREQIRDEECAGICRSVPEWALMRALSPAYHVVRIEATPEGRSIHCRDLRTRNFNSRFGDLDISVGPAGGVTSVQFHV